MQHIFLKSYKKNAISYLFIRIYNMRYMGFVRLI